jgi:RNA polymerase sigma-70 factor (ECF subfamily)
MRTTDSSDLRGDGPPPPRNVDPPHIAEAVAILRALRSAAGRPLDDRESAALATIYRSYAGMLLTVARRLLLGSGVDAEDVLHDVFCDVPEKLPQYRGGGLGGWLRSVTVTTALMRLRKAQYRLEEPFLDIGAADPGEVTPADIRATDRADELDWALGKLSPLSRQVVMLRYFLDYTHQEIADALAMAPSASEVRLCRALKQLRQTLLPRGGGARGTPPRGGPRTRRSRVPRG